jgi:hypothetical protein
MQEFRKTIKLRCVFCRSHEFALPWENYSPPAGSFVVCANCCKENDITSMLIVAKAKGLAIAENYAEQLMNEMTGELKKSFRNSKFIKFK